ncbi:MAG: methylenetetrahydrofolate reductase C-terminal domain-containing protein, partial [Proteobacteria bacterium]|nr:methylenetetrahydrofolate reductase C-terminal domain-containing protein [Pseudomonadota bacterium]
GPCGGSAGGKCEISPDVECIWDMIVRKLMDQGKTGELERLMPLKDWSTARDGGPRIRIKEDLRK